jgi:flagellar basal body rod protein FlgG
VGAEPYKILKDGTVEQAGKNIGQLSMASFENQESLKYMGYGLYSADATPIDATHVNVLQGYAEAANVDLTTEMMNLTQVMRHFESSSNVLKGYDELLESSVNTLGQF